MYRSTLKQIKCLDNQQQRTLHMFGLLNEILTITLSLPLHSPLRKHIRSRALSNFDALKYKVDRGNYDYFETEATIFQLEKLRQATRAKVFVVDKQKRIDLEQEIRSIGDENFIRSMLCKEP